MNGLMPFLQFLLVLVVAVGHGLLWLLSDRNRHLREKPIIGALLPKSAKFKKSPYFRTCCVLMVSS